jgi:hypothetical protein
MDEHIADRMEKLIENRAIVAANLEVAKAAGWAGLEATGVALLERMDRELAAAVSHLSQGEA